MMMMKKHLKTYSKGFQLFNSQGRQRLKRQEISLYTEVMMQAGQDLEQPYYQMELLMRSVINRCEHINTVPSQVA